MPVSVGSITGRDRFLLTRRGMIKVVLKRHVNGVSDICSNYALYLALHYLGQGSATF